MGGHSAWRKRVASGEPAKGLGGAILRHRPHLGRKGADLALNRKGNLGGRPNPKRKATRRKLNLPGHGENEQLVRSTDVRRRLAGMFFVTIAGVATASYVLWTRLFTAWNDMP